MKLYRGRRLEPDAGTAGEVAVEVVEDGQSRALDPTPSLKLRNHSPTGFSWGYTGSGPAQLALAILLDYFGNAEIALTHYMRFKDEIIAELVSPRWTIHGGAIAALIKGWSQ